MELPDSPLRAKRKEMKLTLAQLAQIVGISKASLSKIETGKQKPRVSVVKKLSTETKVAVDAIDPRLSGLVAVSEAAE